MEACRLRLISVETFGHNLSDVPQKDATCTEKGLKAHCDTIKSGSSVEIPKIIVATPTPVPTATPTVEPTAPFCVVAKSVCGGDEFMVKIH